ncbi:MAG: hypothetical protein IJZ79_02295 [Bacilli bacterium]|nr:hypothetical protein [Bacilli bacterium]
MESINSTQLIELLTTATTAYGDRPVFVEVNGHRYIVNDLEFSAKGNTYNLVLNDVRQD